MVYLFYANLSRQIGMAGDFCYADAPIIFYCHPLMKGILKNLFKQEMPREGHFLFCWL